MLRYKYEIVDVINMKIFGKYLLRVDWVAGLLFLVLMVPNVLWGLVPPADDPLRVVSRTQVVDGIASVAQVIMIAVLFLLRRTDAPVPMARKWIVATIGCMALYLLLWVMYYCGIGSAILVVAMAVVPCLSFMAFAIGRNNWLGLIFCGIFLVCHTVFAIANYCI